MSDIRTKLTDALAQTTHGFHSSQLDAIMPIIQLSNVESQIDVYSNIVADRGGAILYEYDDGSRTEVAVKLTELEQRRNELEEKTK